MDKKWCEVRFDVDELRDLSKKLDIMAEYNPFLTVPENDTIFEAFNVIEQLISSTEGA